jgi:hypothetical protein
VNPTLAEHPSPLPPDRLDAIAESLSRDPHFVALLELDDARPADHALALVADISARLGTACTHLADDAFAELVLSVARTRVRFQRVGDDGRLAPEPLVRVDPGA